MGNKQKVKAYRLAIKLLGKEIQRHAFSANLLRFGADNPTTLNAIKKREACQEAIDILTAELESNQLEFGLT